MTIGRRSARTTGAEVSRSTPFPSVEATAQRIADTVRLLLRAKSAMVFRLDPGTGDLVQLAVAGTLVRGLEGPVVLPSRMGVAGLAVKERRAVTSRNLLHDPRLRFPPDLRARFGRSDRAVLAVPLVSGGRVVGALAVRDRAGRRFAPAEVRLAGEFARQAALALENARLYAEAASRQRETEELSRLARVFAETLDLGTLSERMVEAVLDLFGAQASDLRLLQPDGSLVSVACAGLLHDRFEPGHMVPAGIGISGRTATEGRPIWTPDLLTDPGITLNDDVRARLTPLGPRAVLAVPLRAKGITLGALSISDTAGRSFRPSEVALLQAFADQAAVALENARLYREVTGRLRTTEGLLSVSRLLAETLEVAELARRAARELTHLIGADTSIVFDVADAHNRSAAIAGYRVPPGLRDPAYRMSMIDRPPYIVEGLSTGQPVASPDVATDPRFERPGIRSMPIQPRSILYTPVVSKGNVQGAILSYWWHERHVFSPEELALAAGVGAQLAVALENARLHTEKLALAYEEARRRISYDLHDGIAQLIVGAKQHLDTCRELWAADHGGAEGELTKGIDRLGRAIAEMRAILRALRPKPLEEIGLVAAIRQDLEDRAGEAGWEVAFAHDLGTGRCPAELETALFRIVQEALANVARHAKASRVEVTLGREGEAIRLDVRDNGVGFPFEGPRGVGLLSMRERARVLDGSCTVDSAPGAGTRVRVLLPLRPEVAVG